MVKNHSTARSLCFITLFFIGVASSFGLFAQPVEAPNATDDVSFWAELAFWESVKDSRNPAELQAYVDAYPEGRFAALARVRIASLTQQTVGEKDAKVETPAPAVQAKTTVAPGAPGAWKPGDTFRDCEVCPQMVVIPAGRFEMGSDEHRADERPPHAVVIPRAFALGVYEVSVDEWDACLREGGCRQTPEAGREGELPIANISWDNTQDYLKWLSNKTGWKYRLPSEAEWEYAARAGTATSYWWGDERGVKRANCTDCGSAWDNKDASPVGSFEANPYGLYDVHGNVWEWTQDCWNPTYTDAPSDGGPWMRGDCLSRVLRGGSWALDHEYMRSSRRNRYDRDVRYYLNGFRVLRELPALAVPSPTDGDMPFEAAILAAANKVFSNAPKAVSGSVPQTIIIDPLIDGLSATESVATRAMESRIVELVDTNYGRFKVENFTASGAARSPYAIIGTFTGVNKQRKTSGDREAYRICLALLDLKSATVAAKAKVFSQETGVDITPTAFFRDSPVWLADPSTQAYIKTCQATKQGDPIDPLYLEQLIAASLIKQAIDAYEEGQYRTSQSLFKRASQAKGGDQLRTLVGLFLSSLKLGARNQAAKAFEKIVVYGLNSQQLDVKFPFRHGSTEFLTDSNEAGQQDMLLEEIAKEIGRRKDCVEIVGHTHQLGPKLLNQRLSIRRAEYIKHRLEAELPELSTRMIATGRGAEENLIGSKTGDMQDALDQRIEFDVIQCSVSD